MRIGLVVDSACDLPREYFEQHKIQILPVTVHLDGHDLVDTRDTATTLDFYRRHLCAKGDAATSPQTADQIKQLFLSKMVLDFDFVFCITIASSRSPIYDHATQASFAIINEYKPIRAAANLPGHFSLRVIDSQNLFAGQGIATVEAVRLINSGLTNTNKLRERLDHVAQNTYGYMVPRDLHYLRVRAKTKGDRSVGWVGATLGTMLDIKPLLRAYRNETGPVAKLRHFDDVVSKLFAYAGRRVVAGLITPTLCLSYGGELDEMRKLPGYASLMKVCAQHEVEVFESHMSVTGAINVGEGALALGFAAEPHELEL